MPSHGFPTEVNKLAVQDKQRDGLVHKVVTMKRLANNVVKAGLVVLGGWAIAAWMLFLLAGMVLLLPGS